MSVFHRFTLSVFLFLSLSKAANAQENDTTFTKALSAGANALSDFVFASINIYGFEVKWIVGFLALPMILLTFYFGFINIRSFKRAFHILRGDYRDSKAPGEVTQIQALATALSGTIGLGNIASVAAAISVGGPGAVFWMVIIGFLAMTLKFAECTLGVKYRVYNADGSVSGGPMYYLERGLQARGWGKLGKTLAWSYALLALPSLTQIAQTNQAYEAVITVTGHNTLTAQLGFGIFIAILTATVIVGGLNTIAKVTSRLVPAMALIYISAALFVILMHAQAIPAAFVTIFTEAFTPEAGAGGMLGVIVIAMQRAVYSTEAGLGTATMAHAAAKTHEPVSEGMVALMEPFIDTIVICTITALVIVITGSYIGETGMSGMSLASSAFGSVISWFPWVLALTAFLFAFSTIISWAYYCSKIWGFVFGDTKRSITIFQIVFCFALIPGPIMTLGEVYKVLDSLFFLMAIPNVIGIYLMAPEIKRDLKNYLDRLKSGKIQKTR